MAVVMGPITIERLPDNIIVDIFSYLPLKDLCIASSVSRDWNRLSYDRVLWRYVDLTAFTLSVQQLKNIIRIRFNDALISLHMRGHFSATAGPRAMVKNCISVDCLERLNETSPKLRILSLRETNLTDIPIKAMPPSLTALSLTDGFIPPGWFHPLVTTATILPNLINLDLSNSSKTSDIDVESIATARPRLTSLKLNGCYRITSKGLKAVAERLPRLQTLEIAGTRCDDLALHHIGRNLNINLRHLNVSQCQKVGDGCMSEIALMLNRLESLNVSGCRAVTDDGFLSLTALSPTLRRLNVSDTSISKDAIAVLVSKMPSCTFAAS